MPAQLQLPERPGEHYPATVIGSADAIDPSSRTLRVQLEVDNAAGKLIAGSYADVHFDLPATPGALRLPVTALIFRKHGLRVATVDAGDKAAMKDIQIGRDYGTRVEVVAGLGPNDRVIDSPPDWLADGDKVRVASGDTAGAGLAAAKPGPAMAKQP